MTRDLQAAIRHADLTPAEQQIATFVTTAGERTGAYSIKELALATHTSIATIHRFCKKLGLEGFKELKVEVARAAALRTRAYGEVDINFPFDEQSSAADVAHSLESLYAEAVTDTRRLLDAENLARAAELVAASDSVDIYTHSHNLYAAGMFRDRLLSIGKTARCPEGSEQQMRVALASAPGKVAVLISYSGQAPYYPELLALLERREVPVILVSTAAGCELHPRLSCYLTVSDCEHPQIRITQFASHIAVQFALDVLFGAVFARDFKDNMAWLRTSLPYVDTRPLNEGGAR